MRHSFVLILAPLALSLITAPALANNKAGKVIISKGDVNAEQAGARRPLRRGKPVFEGDIISTGNDAMLQMNMRDNGLISIAENSVFSVLSYQDDHESGDQNVLLDMVEGGFRAVTGGIGKNNPAAVKVRTTVASIGIRGTGYEVFQYNDALYVSMLSGTINISNQAGNLLIGDNQEFNFARIDSNNSLPVGLYSLPPNAAANNPFFSAIDVPFERTPYTVPLNQLAISTYPIVHFTNVNPNENVANMDFVPIKSDTDTGNDSGTSDGSDSNNDTTTENIGGNNTALTTEELTALGSEAKVLLPQQAAPLLLSTRVNSNNDTVLLLDTDATESQYQYLIRPGEAGSLSGYPKVMGFNSSTTWGVWLANTSQPATRYSLNDGELTTQSIDDTIYWLTTTPATSLVGTYTFLSTGTYLGTTTQGDVDSLSASMRVNFDSADVSNGFLIVASNGYRWSTTFDGTVSSGANGELGGDFVLTGENSVNGLLSGYFVEENEVFFTGTYSMSDSNNATARGLLAMEGYQTITVYGGDGTNLNQYGTLVAFEGSALLHGPTVTSPMTATQIGYNSTDADGTLAGWFVERGAASNASGYPIQKSELGDNTYWGVWNASASNSANLRYRTRDNLEYNSPIEASIYWMSTDASALTRTGSASFVSSGDFIGSSNSGAVTSLNAAFDFNFDSAAITGGSLNVVAGGDNWTFDVGNAFSTELNMEHGYFSVRQTQVNAESSNGVFGAIEGYFIGEQANTISAAFGLFRQGDSNYLDSVNGLFSMQEGR